MSEEESCEVNLTTECYVESSKRNGKRRENKREQLLSEGADAEESTELRRSTQFEQNHLNSDAGKSRSRKKRKKSTKHCLEDSIKVDASEYDFKAVSSMEGIPYPDVSNAKNEAFENKQIIAKDAEDGRVNIVSEKYAKNLESCGGKVDQRIIKKKKKKTERLLKEAAKANMRGICYLSRVPPHMDPLKLRQIHTQYGELQRIYLVPQDSASQVQRKRAGGFRGQFFFLKGIWVEFTDKRVAKKVANMLNGEQTGGKKRSSFYYDIWNIKYLSKFKWDDLTEETAYKNAVREQKLALEISADKKERDFYLSKVDKSRALSSIEERLKKKQKIQDDSEMNSELAVSEKLPKWIHNFPQTQPVADTAVQNKQRLSKNILARVFGSS